MSDGVGKFREYAEAQRTAFGLARSMTDQANGPSKVADVASGMSSTEMRRALLAACAMAASLVDRAGLDWDDLGVEMEQRLAAAGWDAA